MLWQQQWESWKVEHQGEWEGGGFLNTGTRAPRTKIDTLDQAGLGREGEDVSTGGCRVEKPSPSLAKRGKEHLQLERDLGPGFLETRTKAKLKHPWIGGVAAPAPG